MNQNESCEIYFHIKKKSNFSERSVFGFCDILTSKVLTMRVLEFIVRYVILFGLSIINVGIIVKGCSLKVS